MSDKEQPPDHEEKRQQFRVADTILLDCECIDEAELERRRERIGGQWPSPFMLSSRLHELRQGTTVLRRHAERESSVFARLVDSLERRVDLIAEALMIQAFGERYPEVKEVNVSALGMDFYDPTPVSVGSILDMSMVFQSTGAGLRVFGRVRHCQSMAEDRERYRIGVEFEFTREHDQELMVHLVLQRQSQLLRDR